MLDRNRRIKPRPERFQDTEENFDIVITAEERVYDQVMESKNCSRFPVHHYSDIALFFVVRGLQIKYNSFDQLRLSIMKCTLPQGCLS